MRETLSDACRFIDHYLRAGAEQIYIFFDGSHTEARDLIEAYSDVDAVVVFVCDAAFWQKTYPDIDVPMLVPKQVAIRKIAINQNTSDWLLFCDADEFVTGDESLGAVLSRLPKDCPGVIIPNSEAVWGVGEDIWKPFGCGFERFSFPEGFIGRSLLPIVVYGLNARPMRRGTTGHGAGKHLLRRGVRPNKMKCHLSVVAGRKVEKLEALLPAGGVNTRLVHYDAIGYDRWRMKWENRVSGISRPSTRYPPRIKQFVMIAGALEAGDGEKLFRRFNSLNRWQQFVLRRLGLLARIEM